MVFPGAGAQVYYNEAGEPTGWDYPSEMNEADMQDELDDRDVPFECECGGTFYADSDEDVLDHHETCDTPESLRERFPDINWEGLE